MRISKIRKPYKKSLATALLIIFLVGGISSLIYIYGYGGTLAGWGAKKSSAEGYIPATKEQKDEGVRVKESTVVSTNQKAGSKSDTPTTPVLQPVGKSTVDLTITKKDSANNFLQIRTVIGTLTNSGSCTLTLSRNGFSIVKSTAVQALVSESTCTGFDVPLSDLAAGVWSVDIHFENNSLQADVKDSVTI